MVRAGADHPERHVAHGSRTHGNWIQPQLQRLLEASQARSADRRIVGTSATRLTPPLREYRRTRAGPRAHAFEVLAVDRSEKLHTSPDLSVNSTGVEHIQALTALTM
jgi:hypothetical protein